MVKDTGEDVIPQSMQLIAGPTAQEYNRRKGRTGAFWQDRYRATAIETDEHLQHCLIYIDLNMMRAGVARHPAEWRHSGDREIQEPREGYTVIDLVVLSGVCGFAQVGRFQEAHRQWVAEALARGATARDARWSEALAVGSRGFVEHVKVEFGITARHREAVETRGTYALREPQRA